MGTPKVFHNLSKYRLRIVINLLCMVGIGIVLYSYDYCSSNTSSNILNTRINTVKPFNSALDTPPNDTLPTLCVVARIYYAQISYLPVFALALYHKKLHNVRIYLVNTDIRTNLVELNQTIQFINQFVVQKDFLILLDLGAPSTKKDYGYGMTDRALTYLYRQHSKSSSICEYVTFTNADNFYSRNLMKKILPHMQAVKDIIAWDFLSHHRKLQYQEQIDPNNKTVPEVIDDGTEKCAPVALKTQFVDLGAVTYRLSFLKQHKLYFRQPMIDYDFVSDGYFVEEAAKRTNASILLRQTLFVHQ